MNKDLNKTETFVKVFPAESVKYMPILDRSQGIAMRSGLVTLLPGHDVGIHNTEGHEEIIVVLNGEGEFVSEGKEPKGISENQAVYVPPNTEHNVINNSSELLRYVYIVSTV